MNCEHFRERIALLPVLRSEFDLDAMSRVHARNCLSCHGGPFTPEVPGVLVRSVFPGPEGHPIMSQGSTVVNTTTPLSTPSDPAISESRDWVGSTPQSRAWSIQPSSGTLLASIGLNRPNISDDSTPDRSAPIMKVASAGISPSPVGVGFAVQAARVKAANRRAERMDPAL